MKKLKNPNCKNPIQKIRKRKSSHPKDLHLIHFIIIQIILLIATPLEVRGYHVELPSSYRVFEGTFVVRIFKQAPPPPTEHPQYSWDFENGTELPSPNETFEVFEDIVYDNGPPKNTQNSIQFQSNTTYPNKNEIKNKIKINPKWKRFVHDISVSENSKYPNLFFSQFLPKHDGSEFSKSDKEDEEPLLLEIHVPDHSISLYSAKLDKDIQEQTIVIPCGVIVQGGEHFAKVMKGKEVLHKSQSLMVEWPKIRVEVPIRVETYRNNANITFSFIGQDCKPKESITQFKAWAQLIYHGSARNNRSLQEEIENEDELSPSDHVRHRSKRVLRRTSREINRAKRNSHHINLPQNIKSQVIESAKKRFKERRKEQNKIWPKVSDFLKERKVKQFFLESNEHHTMHKAIPEKKRKLKRIKRRTINYDRPDSLKIRPKYPEGSIPSVAYPSIWNVNTGRRNRQLQYLQNKTVSLYTNWIHTVRFDCDRIGPAGLFSARLITDVSSKPLIIESKLFRVEWAEQFTLHVSRKHIAPCTSPVQVSYASPICVGHNDKIRLYSVTRADVSSADPPTQERYITEMRANHQTRSVQFPCNLFPETAISYCFVYINTAFNNAVSEVRRQCVSTYEENKIQKNGKWGEWKDWTDCTSQCGQGQRFRVRYCNNPKPSNGGKYCQGDSLQEEICYNAPCTTKSVLILPTIPSRPPMPSFNGQILWQERCMCGCTLTLLNGYQTNVAASAADCMGTAIWILQAPENTIITVEVVRSSLRSGAQWLKLRDGNSTTSALLVSFPMSASTSSYFSRELTVAPQIKLSSSGRNLYLEFKSDINSTQAAMIGNIWGFNLTAMATESVVEWNLPRGIFISEVLTNHNLVTVHIVSFVLLAAIFCATAGFAAYYCHRLPVYKRTRLIVDDSPFLTPAQSPTHRNSQVMLKAIPSSHTLTEVLSLKSIRNGLRRESSTSYELLEKSDKIRKNAKGGRRSLPASPFLTRHAAPLILRRSSTQMGRFLRRGSASLNKQKRRSASFDQLETRCISPIHEDTDSPKKLEIEKTVINKEELFVDMKNKAENPSEMKGEEGSKKYKEHRKSLLSSSQEITPIPKRKRIPPKDLKLKKDRVNLERLRKDALTRSGSSNTMRPASSASEVSMAGTEMDLEYDYYDYDMDNACAVPGSLFGLDPTLMPWITIDEDLIERSPSESDSGSIKISFSPEKSSQENIPMTALNIPPTENDAFNRSATSSNESNESNGQYHDDDITPTAETVSLPSSGDVKSPDSCDNHLIKNNTLAKISELNEPKTITDKSIGPRLEKTQAKEDSSPENNINVDEIAAKKEIKILNVDELEDFQFADDTDEE